MQMTIDDAALKRVFTQSKIIAVVGLSGDPARPSHGVARVMQQAGYRIVPVNPRIAAALGEPSFASLKDIPFAVDIVNVFRKTEDVLPIAQDAVAIGAKCLWQQLGVANLQADALARQHGLASVMDRCIKVEYARLMGLMV
jgi:predicted CoA-binding protein